MNVPAEAIELGDDDRALTAPGFGQSCGELGPAIESVGALAGLDLFELVDNVETLGLDETLKRFPLRL
jgi:hypothetical protein